MSRLAAAHDIPTSWTNEESRIRHSDPTLPPCWLDGGSSMTPARSQQISTSLLSEVYLVLFLFRNTSFCCTIFTMQFFLAWRTLFLPKASLLVVKKFNFSADELIFHPFSFLVNWWNPLQIPFFFQWVKPICLPRRLCGRPALSLRSKDPELGVAGNQCQLARSETAWSNEKILGYP